MERILFCVVPEKGHLNPCIGPAQHLQAAGFEVAFYAPADIRGQLHAAGAFTQIGPRAPQERHDLSRGASFAANIRNTAWLRQWIQTLLVDEAHKLVDGIRQTLRQWRPAVVVIDPLLYAAAIAAELQGLPWAALSNSLNPVLPDTLDSELLRTVRQLAPARDQLFAHYGLHADFRGCDVLSPHLTMALTTEMLVGPAPEGVHLVGPALPMDLRGDEPAFPWERLDHHLPLVYMSLGSQLYYHPDVFAKVIRATHRLPLQLVLSVGELAGTDLLSDATERVIAVSYAPQLALLRRTRVFITHGGANSVMEALACGVPMLLSPLCNDQFHSAHFVEQAGAGRRLDLRRANEAQIARAIQSLIEPGLARDRAAQLAASYRQDGSGHAARLISELASGSHRETMS